MCDQRFQERHDDLAAAPGLDVGRQQREAAAERDEARGDFRRLPPHRLADKAERTLFIKDLAIAGALMVIAAQASFASKAAGLGSIAAAANR